MPKTPSFHEELDRADEVTGGSSRAFGLVFTVVLTIVGLWPLLAADRPRLLVLAAAVGLLAIAVARPGWLDPFNKAWLRFGALLGRVVNPVVMALLFFAFVTPFALTARALGKDPLRLRFDGTAESYWIERKGPDPESMRRQF